MRTFEEITRESEAIMAEVVAECSKSHGGGPSGFDEVTEENELDLAGNLFAYYGPGTKHDLFALIAWYSRRYAQDGNCVGYHNIMIRFLGGKGYLGHARVDSTLNPDASEYSTLLSPREVDLVIDWLGLVRTWCEACDTLPDHKAALSHLESLKGIEAP